MSEFAELEKLIDTLPRPVWLKAFTIDKKWRVELYTNAIVVSNHTEHRLDTALTLVLQDLRDMANE